MEEVEQAERLDVIIPTDQNWKDLMAHLKINEQEQLLVYLNDLLEDDELVVQTTLRPEDENIQFVRHPSSAAYSMYLSQICYYASKSLMECVFYGILLHRFFVVKYPPNFKNLAAFVLKLTGNQYFQFVL